MVLPFCTCTYVYLLHIDYSTDNFETDTNIQRNYKLNYNVSDM